MKEIQAQSIVIDAVERAGGAADKLSNRFLIGVSDLLIKLPSRPALLVECKMQDIGKTTKDGHEFKLDVTALQQKFLFKYQKAGMSVCVLSFVERAGLGRRALFAQVFKLDTLVLSRYCVRVDEHIQVPISKAGENVLISLLEGATYGK